MGRLRSTRVNHHKRTGIRGDEPHQTARCTLPAKVSEPPHVPAEHWSPLLLGLDEVPVAYQNDFMARIGPRLLESVFKATEVLNGLPNSPNADSPSCIAMESLFFPTHVLALCGRRSSDLSNHPRHIILQPTHWFILASQCPNLPEISEESSFSLENPTFYAVPLHLPHPAFFEPLHRYLYDHDTTQLLQSLLPLCEEKGHKLCIDQGIRRLLTPVESSQNYTRFLIRVASLLSAFYCKKVLIICIRHLCAFKENVASLGISGVEIWKTMSLASVLLHSAFKYDLKFRTSCE